MRNGSVTLTENKGNVFSHKTKSDRTISPPPAFDNRIFFSCSLSENETRSPSGHSPHSVAGGSERGRRHIPASHHPALPIFSGPPVCGRLQEKYERRGTAGRPNSPKIMPIRREHKKPYIIGPSSLISMPSWVGLVFRGTDSRQIHLFRQSSTAPPPYRRVAMARPFKTTFPTRRPFTMNAPPPCLHRKKPSRKRIACFPSTVFHFRRKERLLPPRRSVPSQKRPGTKPATVRFPLPHPLPAEGAARNRNRQTPHFVSLARSGLRPQTAGPNDPARSALPEIQAAA